MGGGASTLGDGLIAAGYREVTVLDLSPSAFAISRKRLGVGAKRATWMTGSVLHARLAADGYAVWHDWTVFHLLIDHHDRAGYVAQAHRAVRPGGHVIVASFSPDGPSKCSGLDVARYSAESMHAEFGQGFRLLDSVREDHRTPGGAIQAFVYCLCRVEG